ncbi:toprim domain-containing protein, partial [Gemmiger formicilis]|nr:toprim domain-containing protein [Gemmiger formicilis]
MAVFEAAIDAMAEMTLCGDAADKYRLSLGGVSSSGKEPLALQEFLRQHPEITTIELRLDNDAKGRMASVGIRKSTLTATPCMTFRPTSRMEITLIWQKQPDGKNCRPPRGGLPIEKNMKIHIRSPTHRVTGGNENGSIPCTKDAKLYHYVQ